jgi:threonine/homoserine/homoserine lactone efflux protein
MDPSAASFLGFLGLSALVIVTPGPDTALTIRNTLLGGPRAGTLTAVGVAVGQAIWTLATCLGLAALLAASAPAFTWLRWLGAAYLIYLGWDAMFGARRNRSLVGSSFPSRPRLGAVAAMRQGVLSNLGNPKMAVFFASLLPQFAPSGRPTFAGLLALGLVFCLMTLAWLSLYAWVIARAGDVLQRSGVRRAIEGITGAALIAFGVHLATERR